jgi:hypothetical protein
LLLAHAGGTARAVGGWPVNQALDQGFHQAQDDYGQQKDASEAETPP